MLKKQQAPVKNPLSVDFPPLPRLPKLKISDDHAAMQNYQGQLDSWYNGLRTVILDKLNAVKKG